MEIEEELICSLAVRGEKSIHKLLLNILSIVKQLKTIQSDPVLVYQVSTKAQQQLQSQQLQQPQQNTTSTSTNSSTPSTTTPSTTTTTTTTPSTTTTTTTTTSPSIASTKDNTPPTSLPRLNLNFVNDNEKIKELNQNCIQSIINLQKIIKEIISLENKIASRQTIIENDNDDETMKDDDNNNNNTNEDDNNNNNNINKQDKQDQTSISNELERLKLEAYQKNCVIKKLIDNMRLLQLSINSMNRTTTGAE